MNFLRSKGFIPAVCIVTTSVVLFSQSVGANPERGSRYGADVSQSENTSRPSEGKSGAIAQLFYPPVGPSSVLRVIGKGRVVRAADRAELLFEFGPSDNQESSPVEPTALRFRSLSKYKTPKTLSDTKQKVLLTVLTESSFQPILKALTAAGISEQQVQVKFNKGKSNSSALPFPVPSKKTASAATILVRQENPTQAKLDKIVEVVQGAATSLKTVSLSRVGVNYTLKDCQSLQSDVYKSAAQDAQNRAKAIAEAMGVKTNPVPSIAQPFYDLIRPGCGGSSEIPFLDSSPDYDPTKPPVVSLSREIFVTYTLSP
ncbi:MAG: SIMPL domain-containing protein [Acaryochloridaceae cyanobacterium RU_4_10]|nr:SIMPL domain-containing protein [Acaryochloridaceae cyanobacterium RU_4_10]